MPDLFAKRDAWLEGQRHTHLTRAVIYSRGGQVWAVQATVGRSTFELVDVHGVSQRVESRDYLILASELTFEPQAGDEIADGITFTVMSPAGDAPAWRYSDDSNLTFRIHTKAGGRRQ